MDARQQSTQWAITLATLILGITVGLQWHSTDPHTPPVGMPADSVELTIRRLEIEQANLQARITELRSQLEAIQNQSPQGALLTELKTQIAIERSIAGLTPVSGPGVQITLDDARPGDQRANNSPYLVHEYDLRDVLNVLWLGGAEAIAIDNQRITAQTSIYCVGSVILINDTRLSPPFHIRAIGNTQRMLDTLHNPGYLAGIKNRAKRYGLFFEIVKLPQIILPAYPSGVSLHFAQVGE